MTDYRNTTGKRSSSRQTAGFLDDARDFVDEGVDKAKDTVDDAGDSVSNLRDTAQSIGEDSFNAADDAIETAQQEGGVIGQAESFMSDTAQRYADDAGDFANEAADTLAGEGSLNDAMGSVSDTFGDAQDSLDGMLGDAEDAFGDASDSFDSVVSGADQAVEDTLGAGDDFFDNVRSGVDSSIGEVTEFGDSVLGGADNAFNSTLEGGSDILGDFESGLDDTVEGGFDFLEDTQDSFDDALGGAGDTLSSIGDTAIGLGDDAIEGGIDIGGTIAGGAANWVGDISGDAFDIAADIGGKTGEAIAGVVAADGTNQPSGGWDNPTEHESYGQGVILIQGHSDGSVRYFAITRNDANETVALGSGGNGVRLSSASSMNDLPSHNTVSEAKSAIEAAGKAGQGGGVDNDNNADQKQWGNLKEVGTTHNCVIMVQQANDGSKRFFTLTRGDDGSTVAMKSDGTGVDASSVDSAGELPHYPSRSQAESACPSEPENPSEGGNGGSSDDSSNPDGGDGGERSQQRQWGEMNKVGQVDDCVVMRQESNDGAERFFTLTADEDGNTAAVAADGSLMMLSDVESVGELPHYPTKEDAEAACPSTDSTPSQGGNPGEDNSSDPIDESGGLGVKESSIMGVPAPIAAVGGLAIAGGLARSMLDGEKGSKKGKNGRSVDKNVGRRDRNIPGSSKNGNGGR